MGNPNRNRVKSGREKPALELTSYQLVMAICALLLLMCILFISGILVQRFSEGEPSPQLATTAMSESPAAPGSTASGRQPEGIQLAPRPVVLPADSGQSSTSTAAPDKDRESSATYIPAPPPRRGAGRPSDVATEGTKTAAESEKASSSTPSVPASLTKPVAPAQPEAPPEPTPPPAPVEASADTPKDVPEDAPDAETSDDLSENRAETESGPFTIQIASFDATNLERAKQFKKDIELETKFTVNLVPSKDAKHIRAFVGEYDDRAAANEARDGMRKTKGFEDCFVKSLEEE